MYNFDIIEKIDKTYKGKHYIKTRELSTLEFNARVLELARDVSIPVMERLNFIEIVFSNIDEFISIRLIEGNDKERRHYIYYIQKLYEIMEEIFISILQQNTLEIGESNNNTSYIKGSYFTDGGIYYVYINQFDKFNIVPLSISKDITEEKIKFSNPETLIQFSFLVRFVSDKSFTYMYTGERTPEILNEIKNLVHLKENAIFNYILTTCDNEFIMRKFLQQMSLDIEAYIHVGEVLIQLKPVMERIKSCNTDSSLFYPKFIPEYLEKDYYTELLSHDIMIYNPHESYKHVTDFIDQMCVSENIVSIFSTLYRTSENSVIANSLIKAKESGKSVYVFVEPMARGNEERNVNLIERLTANGIHVSCNYYNYKVHSKMFSAIDKNGVVYTHIGTGNYNESTAKVYTDLHLLTTNRSITLPALGILQCLFKKKIYFPDMNTNDSMLFSSPINLREEILKCIDKEIRKKENGRIYIKCNSLCDLQVIDELYKAARAGVDIKLIVRTSCSILPRNNIEIRSKVGRFLEHDRIYIFGNDVYISSADLLLRNINKRVEVLCKIIEDVNISKVFNIFCNIWNGGDIQYIGKDFRWHRID